VSYLPPRLLARTPQMDYNNIAVALLATVAGLRTFSAGRAVFYREAASGLKRRAVARRRWPAAACTAAAHDLLVPLMVGMAVTHAAMRWRSIGCCAPLQPPRHTCRLPCCCVCRGKASSASIVRNSAGG
jgi:ABC-2 type transporter